MANPSPAPLFARYVVQLARALAKARKRPGFILGSFQWAAWDAYRAGYREGRKAAKLNTPK